MSPSLSLSSVTAILILAPDASGDNRLFAKYYTPPHHAPGAAPTPAAYASLKEQKAFEKGLLEKTAKQTSDVILYDNKVVVFKSESDVMLYVVGQASENEVLLYNVVLCLRDSLAILMKYVPSLPPPPLSHARPLFPHHIPNPLLTFSLTGIQPIAAPSWRTTTSCPWQSTRSSTTASSSRPTQSWSPAASLRRPPRTRPT
jgi:hypothetical protein